jgi:hypothetical protein
MLDELENEAAFTVGQKTGRDVRPLFLSVLFCVTLYCTVLHYTVLYYTTLYYTALH